MDQYGTTYRQNYVSPEASSQIGKNITCDCVRNALEELLQINRKSNDLSGNRSCIEQPSKADKPKSRLSTVKLPACGKSRDERSARVDLNHYKTTYQVDYSDPAGSRLTKRKPYQMDYNNTAIAHLAQCTKPLTNGKDTEQPPCCVPVNIIIQPDFRQCYQSFPSKKNDIPKAKTSRGFSREGIPKCGKMKEQKDENYPLWKSEYQDNIGRIGHIIIKAKLHHDKRNVPMYITSN